MPTAPDFMTRLYNINDRVRINYEKNEVINNYKGTIIGYASEFPMMYIVLLDEPLVNEPFCGWRGVTVPGSMLAKE